MKAHKFLEKEGYKYYYVNKLNYFIKTDSTGSYLLQNKFNCIPRSKPTQSIDSKRLKQTEEELSYVIKNNECSSGKVRQNVIMKCGRGASLINDIRIVPTLECNLGCHYCHQRKYVKNIQGRKMNREIAAQVVNFICSKKIGPSLQIKFYGGEPFLNFPAIQYIVENLSSCIPGKNILQFSVTTNGLLMNDTIIDFLIKHNFHTAVSLDGPAILHNKNRTYKNGRGTFNRVFKNIEQIKKINYAYFKKNLSILATLDSECVHDFKIATDFFAEIDLSNVMVNWIVKKDGLTSINNDILKDITYNIINHNHRRVPFLNLMNKLDCMRLDKSNLNDMKIQPCGAGKVLLAISPSGDLYPCEQFLDRVTGKIGDIFNGLNTNIVMQMHCALNNKVLQCLDCWAIRFCPYNCFFVQLVSKYDYCDFIRKQTGDIMRMFVELAENDVDSYVELISYWHSRSEKINKYEYCVV